jgi:hypothetical protein
MTPAGCSALRDRADRRSARDERKGAIANATLLRALCDGRIRRLSGTLIRRHDDWPVYEFTAYCPRYFLRNTTDWFIASE